MNRNSMNRGVQYFQTMTQFNLELKHSNNGLYLSILLQKLDFSILVNISLYIVFCKCNSNNNSSKGNSSNIASFVTGPERFLSCFHCGLALHHVVVRDCIWSRHFAYNSDCIHLLQNAPTFVVDKNWFYSRNVSFLLGYVTVYLYA